MRLKYLVWFLVFMLPVIAGAQGFWESNKPKLADFCSAECTRLYLENMTKKSPKENANYQQIKNSLASNSWSNPLTYENLKNLLSENFSQTLNKVSSPVQGIAFDQIQTSETSNFPEVVIDSIKNRLTVQNAKQIDLKKLKNELDSIGNRLRVDYNKVPPDDNNSAAPPLPSGTQLSKQNIEQKDVAKSDNRPSWWDILGYLLFAIMAAAIFINKRSQQARVDRHRNELETLKEKISQIKTPAQGLDIDTLTRTVKQLINTDPSIQRLSEDQQGLSDRMSKLDRSADSPVKAFSRPIHNDTAKEPVFYMAYPVNNAFLVQSMSQIKTDTMYVFRPFPGGGEAEFELHTGGGVPVSNLISGVELYIRSACIEQNLPRIDARNIITRKPGLAVFEGDRWTIRTKAEIFYE